MIEKFLAYAKSNNCSDVHITTGGLPMIRIHGDIMPIPNTQILSEKDVMSIIDSVMNEKQKDQYNKNMGLDFSFQTSDNLRFRVNVFLSIQGPCIAFREIPLAIKSLEELQTPQVIKDFSNYHQGLVLVVGPTGSGKSTTLAAIIDNINKNQKRHIITIEDPVEFVHNNKQSLINQREIGTSVLSFSSGLRNALREDPDVILVGEMRDTETIRLALTAAETGHLVLGTIHTNSASQTINRIIDVFPPEDKAMVRSMLSSSIRAVISQRLIKNKHSSRTAAYEVMIANSSIRNLIREDKIPQINSIIELNKKSGMNLMKDSIAEMLSKGIISQEVADETLSGIY